MPSAAYRRAFFTVSIALVLGGEDLADPVGNDVDGACFPRVGQALAQPARKVRSYDVVRTEAHVDFGQDPPAAGPIAASPASKWGTDLAGEARRYERVARQRGRSGDDLPGQHLGLHAVGQGKQIIVGGGVLRAKHPKSIAARMKTSGGWQPAGGIG